MRMRGKLGWVLAASLCTAGLARAVPAAEGPPGRQDPLFQQIDRRLAEVRAIDNHTHLLWAEQFNPEIDPMQPLGLKSTKLMARNPGARSSIGSIQKRLHGWMAEAGLGSAPADLDGYLTFADQVLARWRDKGAVAIKFLDAYLRTLRFEEVPEERARRLYAEGLARALSREEYLALQDFLARRLFLKAGELKLPVHIHSSHGVPPFLRLYEADVRNLELVLTDPRFFGTSFVLIHGGVPLVEEAAYLAFKPHVWIDVSAQPFLFPVPDVAANLRKYLVFASGKVLFGTDPGNYPGVPVGPEVLHAAASYALREALSLALAGLVRDGVVSLDSAVQMGQGVLRDNARRLYGWTAP